MKKITLITFITFIFSGGLAAYYGLTNSIPLLAGLGLVSLSIGLVIIGIENIFTRESIEQDDAGGISTYRGWSAIFGGFLWIVLGIALLTIGVAVMLGFGETLFHWLLEHPGLGLIGSGLLALAIGGQNLLGTEEERGSTWSFVVSLPGRVFALFMILLGVSLLAVGFTEILLPVVFRNGLAAIQLWWQGLQCQMSPIYC